MGQKVNPHGLRVGIIKDWDSRWYAEKDFADNLVEDDKIRKYIKNRLYSAGISRTEIERASDRVKIIIHTAKPGIVIGRGGSAIDELKKELEKLTGKKLIIEITTNGSILPKDALKEAAKILIYHLMLFSDDKITIETTETDGAEEFDEDALHMRQLLKTKLVDMDLSVRALNCLKSAEVETLGELVVFNKTDLLKFRNFGKKSLTELDELLANLGLSFGMDISKYKLDKE